MTTDISVQIAVRDLCIPLVRADGSHIARQTTLADAVSPGDATVTLTSATGFTNSSLIRYDDTSVEPSLYIINNGLTGNVATTTHAAAFAHAAGTTVYTNLFHFAPWDIAAMLSGGDPVIFIHVTRYTTKQTSMPATREGTFMAHLQYHRLLNRPDPSVNPDEWAERQEILGRSDVGIINNTLLGNTQLLTQHNPNQALQMAKINTQGDMSAVDWGRVNVEGDTWHWIGTIDAIYAGNPYRPT